MDTAMTPEERKWWRRLCRVLAEQPDNTVIMVETGGVALLRTNPDPREPEEGVLATFGHRNLCIGGR